MATVLLAAGNLPAANWYVATNATDTFNGQSWQTAFTNQDWMSGATDLAGVRRIFQGRVDMGCYETIPPKGNLLMVE